MRSTPSIGAAHRRHMPCQGEATVPVTMTPPAKDSSVTSQMASAPSGTELSAGDRGTMTPSGSTGPVRTSCQRVPGVLRSLATCTTKGSTCTSFPARPPAVQLVLREVLVEEPWLVARGDRHRRRLGRRRSRRLQLVPSGTDRAGDAFQHDLHAGELLVAVVLGLVPQAPRFFVGVVEDPLRHQVRLPD